MLADVDLTLCVVLVLSSGVWSACVPEAELSLPELGSGAKSFILGIEREGDPLVAFARDLDLGPAALAVGEGSQLTLIVLERPLADYQLGAGLLPPSLPEDEGRALPPAAALYAARFDGDDRADWAALSVLGAAFADYRIAKFDPVACAESGRCVSHGVCTERCPAREEADAPLPPARVELACPEGWSETAIEEGNDHHYCRAFGVDPRSCPRGQAIFPGDAACSALGSCSIGQFADVLPPGPVLYVDSAAAAGGDGSLAAPYRALDDAVLAAAEGAVLALARGRHVLSSTIAKSLHLAGACAATTELSPGPGHATITLDGAHSSLRNVSVTGARGGVRALGAKSDVLLEDVSVAGGAVCAVCAGLGRLSLSGVTITGAGDYGVAVFAADVSLDRVSISGGAGSGIVLSDAATVASIDRTYIADLGGAGPDHGTGIRATSTSRLEIRRSVIERSRSSGLDLAATSSAGVSDVVVRDVASQEDGKFGHGIRVTNGAKVDVSRVFIERTHAGGLAVFDAGTNVAARDVITHCQLAEEIDREVKARGDGVAVHSQATLSLDRLYSLGDVGHGLIAANAVVVLADLEIDRACDGVKQETPAVLWSTSDVLAERVSVRRARNDGVQVMAPATVSVSDLDVMDTEHNALQILCGADDALMSACAGPIAVARAHLARSNVAAVLVGAVSPVTFADLVIANEDEAGRLLGLGFDVRRLGVLAMRRFEVHGATTGFRVIGSAQLDLEHGYIHDNGHAIEADGEVDLGELFEEIEYRGNATLYVPL